MTEPEPPTLEELDAIIKRVNDPLTEIFGFFTTARDRELIVHGLRQMLASGTLTPEEEQDAKAIIAEYTEDPP